MLPVSAEVGERAGVAAGDQVDVDLELDTEPREVAVPADLADALDRDLDARRALDALSYRGKQRLVLASSRPRPPRRGGGASPGRSRSCGRAATGRGNEYFLRRVGEASIPGQRGRSGDGGGL